MTEITPGVRQLDVVDAMLATQRQQVLLQAKAEGKLTDEEFIDLYAATTDRDVVDQARSEFDKGDDGQNTVMGALGNILFRNY